MQFLRVFSFAIFCSVTCSEWNLDHVFEATVTSFDSWLHETHDSNFEPTVRYEKIRNLIAKEAHHETTNRNSIAKLSGFHAQLIALQILQKKIYQSALFGWQWTFATNLGKYLAYLSQFYGTGKFANSDFITENLGLCYNVSDGSSSLEKVTLAMTRYLSKLFQKIPKSNIESLLGKCHQNLTFVCFLPADTPSSGLRLDPNEFIQTYTKRQNEQFDFCDRATLTFISCPVWFTNSVDKSIGKRLKIETHKIDQPEAILKQLVLHLSWNHDIATNIYILAGSDEYTISETTAIRKQMALLSQIIYEQNTRLNAILLHKAELVEYNQRFDLFRSDSGQFDNSYQFPITLSNIFIISLMTGGTYVCYDGVSQYNLSVLKFLPILDSGKYQILTNRLVMGERVSKYGSFYYKLSVPSPNCKSLFINILCATLEFSSQILEMKVNHEIIVDSPGYFVRHISQPNKTLELEMRMNGEANFQCHVVVVGEYKTKNLSKNYFFADKNVPEAHRMYSDSKAAGTKYEFTRFHLNEDSEGSWRSMGSKLFRGAKGIARLQDMIVLDYQSSISDRLFLPNNRCRNGRVELNYKTIALKPNAASSCNYAPYVSCFNGSIVAENSDKFTIENCDQLGKKAQMKLICGISYDESIRHDTWKVEDSSMICDSFTSLTEADQIEATLSIAKIEHCESFTEKCTEASFYLSLEPIEDESEDVKVFGYIYNSSGIHEVELSMGRDKNWELRSHCCFEKGEIRLVKSNGFESVHQFDSVSSDTAEKDSIGLILGSITILIILFIIIIILITLCLKQNKNADKAAAKKTYVATASSRRSADTTAHKEVKYSIVPSQQAAV